MKQPVFTIRRMRPFSKAVVLLLLSLSFMKWGHAQYHYPPTKTVDQSDTYFGVTYHDPYRWLEDMKDPEVVAWFKQQADFSDSYFKRISGRETLLQELEKLNRLQQPLINEKIYRGGRLFYKKQASGEYLAKLYYREGLNGSEILLFDPNTFVSGEVVSVESMLPSYDGKKIAIAYSSGGREVSKVAIMDVDQKKLYPETIYPTLGEISVLSWMPDSKGFLYHRITSGDQSDLNFIQNTKTLFHRIGTDTASDKDIFSAASYPELQMQPRDLPLAYLRERSPDYIFASPSSMANEQLIYFAPFGLQGKLQWKTLCHPTDSIEGDIRTIGDDAYAISHKNAKNRKLLRTSLLHPDWDKADVVFPERKDENLRSFTLSRDYIVATYSDGINHRLFKYNLKTKKVSEIKMPFSGTTSVQCLDEKTNHCYVQITSWKLPETEFELDLDKDVFSASVINKPVDLPAEYLDVVVKELEVKGHDGTMIPLSIIHKKGMRLDGKNICLVTGYGSYGFSIEPSFSPLANILAAKEGVVFALAHVRGGGEKGEEWRRGGFKTTKPNTWKDFISCAEYLVEEGYTSPSKLAGMGTSAGGILISRALTERPELFAVAQCNVGWANAMRMEFSPNGPDNVPEFGSTSDSIESRALYEMDGVQHVKKGVRYPAVLCVAGWNDPRVSPWQPAKFAAALQQATTSQKPVFLKVDYAMGHGTPDMKVMFQSIADQLAFILWQCGHPDFKLKEKADR